MDGIGRFATTMPSLPRALSLPMKRIMESGWLSVVGEGNAAVGIAPPLEGGLAVVGCVGWVGEGPDEGEAVVVGVGEVSVPALGGGGGVVAEFDDVADCSSSW